MDLSTRYLGFELPHPLIVGASPQTAGLDSARRLEDCGAAALVLPSIFEEQFAQEDGNAIHGWLETSEISAEAQAYFPDPAAFAFGPDGYLEQIRKLKAALGIPVIASLNGSTPSGWLDYAQKIEQAGADALELNLYHLPTNVLEIGEAVERRGLECVRIVREAVSIPVSVKLSPYFSSLPHFAKVLEGASVDGLVLFNRFLQPDLDLEALEVNPCLELSDSSSLRLRLRWLAILSASLRVPLAASGGIHTVEDAVKAILVGASALQVVSALYARGPEHLQALCKGLARWLSDHEYESLAQARGSMNLRNSPDPAAFERANYLRVIAGWKV